jgi:hypothetical protein
MEIELKLFDYGILVDMGNPKEVIQTANGLINDLELYNQKEEDNYSAKYACTREALNKLFAFMVEPK